MIRIILIVAVFLVLVIVLRQIKNTAPEHRKKTYLKLGIGLSAAVVLLLAFTGRIHWIGGLIAACVPFIRALLPYALRFLPSLQRYFNRNQQQPQTPPPPSVNLSVAEAFQVLGLEPDADQEAVIAAHRKLIQKIHPDRGGNDFLAAQINQAKQVLLKHLS